jgi:hypothetical protein
VAPRGPSAAAHDADMEAEIRIRTKAQLPPLACWAESQFGRLAKSSMLPATYAAAKRRLAAFEPHEEAQARNIGSQRQHHRRGRHPMLVPYWPH